MNGSDAGSNARQDAEGDQLARETQAARERQSHVRHELRAPFAVIYPLLSLLLDGSAGELTKQQREYLEVLDRNVMRLEALVTGVAASGWMDCSAAPRSPDAVVLGDVADELASLIGVEGAQGPSVRVEAGEPPGHCAWADRDDVRHILEGLVRNAAAYAPAGDAVVIRARAGEETGTVILEVEDAGPGIPREELGQVLEFGFRGELARDLKVPGLGAGLWVGRELARRNGGDLRLASEPGAGVTATLTLPAATEDEV